MTFNWSVIGHKKIVDYLQKSVENDHVNHAYLFYGAMGLGKSVIVNYFVKTIFCLSDKDRPCGVCSNCHQIKKGIHPDIVYLKREEDKKNITVEQVRQMKTKMQAGTFLNSYKAVIIEEADFLSAGAGNAMLKILEEPMGKTVFLLTAKGLGNILPTIISRSQLIKFLPVGKKEFSDYLINNLNEEKTEAYKLASMAAGYPGRVLDLVGHKKITGEKEKERKDILDSLSGDINARFSLAERVAGQSNSEKMRQEAIKFLDDILFLVRDMALVKNMSFQNISNVFLRDRLGAVSSKYKIGKLVEIMERIKLTQKMIKQNVNTRLALERLMMEF